jgi:acetone carboxylase, beta subunit
MSLAFSSSEANRNTRFASRLPVEAMFNQGELETLMEQQLSHVQVLGIDAGGTMTDTFFVRSDGRFVVGKAQSNPADESLAILESSKDALTQWAREVDEVYPELVTCVYSGTAMLNRVVQRKGLDVGLICNRGFEQIHSMGRAIQSYLGYALEERIHLNTHRYDEPLFRAKS